MGFAQFMQGGGWALFALVAAMFSAVFFLINQYLKMPGHLLVFWMRVLAVLCLTPLVATLTMPVDPRFYIGVALTVIGAVILALAQLSQVAQSAEKQEPLPADAAPPPTQ
jgi:hypothetical protein